ncbi:MAG: T9SS type A sorting domain-containing protein [Bacteroidia bacterium]|nr:T9SS type A sorting domain-containing protein [Bacteroidia bacterium]
MKKLNNILKTANKNKVNAITRFAAIILVIISSKAGSQTSFAIPNNGLVAYWPFNGNTANQITAVNNASVSGATLTKDRAGQASSAYRFSGSNDSIYIPAGFYSNVDSNFTISFWFRSRNQNRMQPLNINDGGFYTSNLNFSFNDGSAVYNYWNSDGDNNIVFGQTNEFTNNIWHNMILTKKDSVLKIYVDGLEKGSANYNATVNINKAITLSGKFYHWAGDLDDIAIYNRSLSQVEIDVISTSASSNIIISTPTANDAYPINTDVTIKWFKHLNTDTMKIEYSINNGTTWQLINDSVAADVGYYNWTVPSSLPNNNCLIKVTDINNVTQSDISDAFVISKHEWLLVNPNNSFVKRDGAGACVFKDTMYLLGGWNPLDSVNFPNLTSNEIWKSTDGNNWTLAGNAPWESRHTFGTLVFNNKIWVLGGDQQQNHFQPDIWNSSDGINWNLIDSAAPWGDRVTHMSCVFNNKMWVMGGQKVVGPNINNTIDTVYNDVWNSTDGINWTKVTDSAGWAPRAQIEGYCVFNNKMWIFGGGTYNGTRKYFNDVWNSSDGINWTLVNNEAPWEKRQYHEVIVYDNLMWIIGGWDGFSNRSDVWYSQDGITWHELKNTPWYERHASSVYNYNNSLWMVAGNMWNDSWRLNNLVCESVTSQPSNQLALSSSNATFSTIFPGNYNSYQWQTKINNVWQNIGNTSQYSGVTTSTLVVSNVNLANNGSEFRCLINSGVCSDTTSTALLNVQMLTNTQQQVIEDNVLLYPNPTNGTLNVQIQDIGSQKEFVSAEILNILGQLIEIVELTFTNKTAVIDLNKMNNGIYIVNLKTETGSVSKKIVVSK